MIVVWWGWQKRTSSGLKQLEPTCGKRRDPRRLRNRPWQKKAAIYQAVRQPPLCYKLDCAKKLITKMSTNEGSWTDQLVTTNHLITAIIEKRLTTCDMECSQPIQDGSIQEFEGLTHKVKNW